jgi:hypothetical protein
MLRQSHADENNQNNEEQRENRLRNPSPSFAIAEVPVMKSEVPLPITLAERVSPKFTKRATKVSTHLSPKKQAKRNRLWRELVSENPMYHKELLAGRRNIELRTPWRRFFAKAIPIGTLGSIYASIYYAISWVYDQAYDRFNIAATNIEDGLYRTTQIPGTSPIKYAMEQSIAVSAIVYSVIMILLFLVIGIGIPLVATLRITNEREKMNWNALIMSRLTPAQILVGKAAPVLRLVGMIYLAVLPALVITALLVIFPAFSVLAKLNNEPRLPNTYFPQTNDIAWWLLRVAVLPPVVILVTGVLNTMIATYYSLVKKRGGEASVGAMRGTFLPIFGPLGLSGLFYAVPNFIYFVQNKMQTNPVSFADWADPLLFSPNVFSPIGALIASFWPQFALRNDEAGQMSFADNIWFYLIGFAPFIYILTSLGLMQMIWRRMLKVFGNTPKDASG